MSEFKRALQNRRSIYNLSKETTMEDNQLINMLEEIVEYTPTAFHSQSAKIVVLLNDNHTKLWEITKETLRKIVPVENFERTETKMNGFSNSYGAILFFDDTEITENLMKQFPLYEKEFPIWSDQANAMLQSNIWVALADEGLGANLQHYNPLIDDKVKEAFNIPKTWRLIAQMPFGKFSEKPPEKPKMEISKRVLVKE